MHVSTSSIFIKCKGTQHISNRGTKKGMIFFKKRKHDSTNLKDIQEKRDKENRQPPLGEWKEICKNICKKVSSRILS